MTHTTIAGGITNSSATGHPTARKSPIAAKQTRFLIVYLLGLAMAFSPSKALGQIAPLIVMFLLVFFVQVRPKMHLRRFTLVLAGYLAIGALYARWLTDFNIYGYLLFLITASAALFLFFDFSTLVDPNFMRRLGHWTLPIIVLQAIYGIIQFVLSVATLGLVPAVGDAVWGTLAPPLDRRYAGTSPFFIILISTLAIFVVAVTPKLTWSRVYALVVVALCWMVAELLHSVVYFAAALVVTTLVLYLFGPRGPRMRHRGTFIAVVFMLILFGAGFILHGNNYSRIATVIGSVTEYGPEAKFRKLRAVYFTLERVPEVEPRQPWFGLGPGQYSSRAALMLTGEYLSRSGLPLPDYMSPLTEQFVMPLFYRTNSSTHSPASSWIAHYGETGWTGVALLLLLLLLASWHFARNPSPLFPRLNFAMLTLMFYIFFMGFQNVYWEYTQAVFPMMLLFKLGYDYVTVEQRRLQTAPAPVPAPTPLSGMAGLPNPTQ